MGVYVFQYAGTVHARTVIGTCTLTEFQTTFTECIVFPVPALPMFQLRNRVCCVYPFRLGKRNIPTIPSDDTLSVVTSKKPSERTRNIAERHEQALSVFSSQSTNILGPEHELQAVTLSFNCDRSINFMAGPEPPAMRNDRLIL